MATTTVCPKCEFEIVITKSMVHKLGESEVFTIKEEGDVMSLDKPTGKKFHWVEFRVHCPFCGHDFKC